MSSQPGLVRPPQATVAGWLVVAGSVLVALLALDQGARLHSLETREAVTDYLSGSGERLGLSVQNALTALRIITSVAAASAAATAVLGWYVLQRSKGARLALSWLAVPLFVSGFFSAGPAAAVPAMVCAAIVMLWFQPARDWFDGITPAPPSRPVGAPPAPGRDPLLDLPPPTAPPLHPAPYAVRPTPAATSPAQRPTPLAWACVVAWISTATVFTFFGLSALQFAVAPGQFIDDVRRAYPEATMSDADLKAVFVTVVAVAMVWSAAVAGLAVLVWRRVSWASVALTVSAVLACVTVLPVLACVATVVLLHRPESRAWLSG